MARQKAEIYKDLLQRYEKAATAGFFYEANWFAYAIFEDRTRSIVFNSGDGLGHGGIMSEKLKLIFDRHDARVAKVVNGRPVRLQGRKVKVPKYPHLHTLRRSDILILRRWAKKRNELSHALATGQLSLTIADQSSAKLSLVAGRLLGRLCAAARRLKKLRAKKKKSKPDEAHI